MDSYFEGKKLYGDEFSLDEIKSWYEDEAEGYAGLGAADRQKYQYAYHALNRYYGFRLLPDKTYSNVLGFGSAYGDEFTPILSKIERLTIVDPSDSFVVDAIESVPVRYIKPNVDGVLPFDDNSFDLIVCLGVLHHVPNVGKVIKELARCLVPGGFFMLREPTISMGDWREPRKGLTKRERGIPIGILRYLINEADLQVVSEARCMFSLTSRLKYLMRQPVYNSNTVIKLDRFLCWLFGWNTKYHYSRTIDKLRPTSIYYVLKKPNIVKI